MYGWYCSQNPAYIYIYSYTIWSLLKGNIFLRWPLTHIRWGDLLENWLMQGFAQEDSAPKPIRNYTYTSLFLLGRVQTRRFLSFFPVFQSCKKLGHSFWITVYNLRNLTGHHCVYPPWRFWDASLQKRLAGLTETVSAFKLKSVEIIEEKS